MSKTVIITVTTDTPVNRLHPDDVEVAGVYGVILGDGPGEYPSEPRNTPQGDENPLEEAALDVFHDHIGIEVLDDFEVDVTILPDGDDGPNDVHWL